MAKVITFSKEFPAYHPRAGEPTFFVEKIWSGLLQIDRDLYTDYLTGEARPDYMKHYSHYEPFEPKFHTIRLGHRWKSGDKFSPRVWSGKPYASKQIVIAPDIEIVRTWDVEFDADGCLWIYSKKERGPKILDVVAKNDGLTKEDLFAWLNKPFTGQIICWNENIKY